MFTRNVWKKRCLVFLISVAFHLGATSPPFHWSVSPSSSPSGRTAASMIYDPLGEMILFGGRNEKGPLNETWAYSQDKGWERLYPSHSPSRRYGAAMAYDSSNGLAILFGGYDRIANESIALSETWVLNINVADHAWERLDFSEDSFKTIFFNGF